MKNRGCLIGLIAIVVIASIGLGYYFYSKNAPADTSAEVEKPVVTDIVEKSVATGSIKPRKEVNVKPQVSGVVDELYVEAGQIVEKGQRLAKIKLVPSEVNINNAKSSVELARIRYQEALREFERQKEVADKNLDVENAKVNYENALQEEQRYRDLFEEGMIAQQEYNRYQLDLNVRLAEFENAKIRAKNNLKQFKADVDIRKQELDAAINNLELLREGASKNSRQVANVVTSTVAGMVLDVPVEEGTSVIERNNFNEGTTIATVADMNYLIFEGMVDEADVGKIKEGMDLILTVGAINDQKFTAKLEYISPKGVDENGTVKFEIRAALDKTEDVFLRAGYSANADIILNKKESVIAIKERDVLFEKDTTFIEVKNGSGQFEKKLVTLGLSDGVQIEVVKGIDTNAMVKVQKKL